MHNPAHVLDRYLSLFEDYCLISAVFRNLEGLPLIPALTNAPSFRKELLGSGQASGINMEKYELSATVPEGKSDPIYAYTEPYALAPYEILSWTCSSRRVFQLSPEMQQAFESISVADIPINEVVFPFDSFVVTLPTRIWADDQWVNHLLISKPFNTGHRFQGIDGSNQVRSVRFLSGNIPNYNPIRSDLRREAEAALKADNANRLRKFLEAVGTKKIRTANHYTSGFYIFSDDKDWTLVELCKGQGLPEGKEQMMQVVFNLCIYLEALPEPEEQPHRDQTWERTPRLNRISRLITDETEVCTVSGIHTLHSLGEHKSARKGLYEITEPHWRRGHKRRLPGEGHIPEAVRSVKVKPTLVRPDLLPAYGLPAGAVTRVC